MLNKFLSKITFESYKDFVQNFQIRIPTILTLHMMLLMSLPGKTGQNSYSMV